MITKLDFVAIHSPDSERSRRFYADTLGLRADEHAQFELWAGDTCLGIWKPARLAWSSRPRRTRVSPSTLMTWRTRAPSRAKGVTFVGETLDTGVCHTAFFTDPDGNDLLPHHRYAT
jgi:hypothetical protein